MNMQHIIIAGASGAVGEGMTTWFLSKGHRVTAVVRTKAKEQVLINSVRQEGLDKDNLTVIVNAFDNETAIQELTHSLKALGKIDMAIASLGGWYHGEELHTLPMDHWDTVLTNSLSAHFRFAKAVIPVLEAQGQGKYVMVNGGASEYAVPHSGVISISAAAQKMMGQVLQQELKAKNIQVYGVAAFDLVRTKQRNNKDDLWLGAEEIAEYILRLSEQEGDNRYWHRLQSPQDLQPEQPAGARQ